MFCAWLILSVLLFACQPNSRLIQHVSNTNLHHSNSNGGFQCNRLAFNIWILIISLWRFVYTCAWMYVCVWKISMKMRKKPHFIRTKSCIHRLSTQKIWIINCLYKFIRNKFDFLEWTPSSAIYWKCQQIFNWETNTKQSKAFF